MRKGFTLIEIMIIIAVIGLLAAVAIPLFMRVKEKKEEEKATITNSVTQVEESENI